VNETIQQLHVVHIVKARVKESATNICSLHKPSNNPDNVEVSIYCALDKSHLKSCNVIGQQQGSENS